MYNPTKPKPKIDPMTMDFDFMIRNHPEFFTKLSSQNIEHPPSQIPTRPPPASGGYSSGLSYTGYSNPQPMPTGRKGSYLERAGGAGATLKPKTKKGRNNFFK
jgi:hypothetical protein